MYKLLLFLFLVSAVCLAQPTANLVGVRTAPNVQVAEVPEFGEGTDDIVFSEDFESGNLSSWVVSQEGANSLSDSPGGDYLPDTDSWAMFNNGDPIDLTGSTNPDLVFWWYGKYFDAWDYMKVEVSTDGAVWDSLWSTEMECEQTDWTRIEVDLSAYGGDSIYLRFFVHSTSVVEYDGGHFKDVLIGDDNTLFFYDYCDDMSEIVTGGANDTWGSEDEGMLDQWSCIDESYEGLYSAIGSRFLLYKPDTDSYMIAEDIDLSAAFGAELNCYVSWDPWDAGDVLTVEVDDGGGWEVAATLPATSGWEPFDVNLDSYIGGPVDIRFHLVTNGTGNFVAPMIDAVEVDATLTSLEGATWGEIKTLFQN